MPSLYLSSPPSGPAPTELNGDCLALTATLLRPHLPGLADTLLALSQKARKERHKALTNQTLYQHLGAEGISQVIAQLTHMGNQWLAQGRNQANSTQALQQVLRQWIAVGEWLIEQAQQ
ncbi:hypothetical protein [Gilvimarinus xylanilyticus]|uniref:Uncharacterized protein n=1 Tax=Gilvimarinus xylanilyticus TaxID=2944139 RepID=A0A9X2I378_9GAMM|nr:hypothetical protein [Gilvimarinus xylanilyticus]MCP8899166.1 hypothetical protein [Gilvimarinus xylanilyticus]